MPGIEALIGSDSDAAQHRKGNDAMSAVAAPASTPGTGVGINKVMSLNEAMASVTPGTRLMMGEFVGRLSRSA